MVYSSEIARHYAAYRPPLHEIILEKCLGADFHCASGLDVGCGTGRSSMALAVYCDRVVGVEPAAAMLAEALPHEKIEYRPCDGVSLDFPDDSFEVITLAGSLYYAKSQRLLDEVARVAKSGAVVAVYDFYVRLKDIYARLGVHKPETSGSYNHAANFSGLVNSSVMECCRYHEVIELEISSDKMAHLLLASESGCKLLQEKYPADALYEHVVYLLEELYPGEQPVFAAGVYYTKYTIKKGGESHV